ncbi:MAG: hypothetical protein GY781_07530 [Gammaproteobacteria bacterium]|nr:hypothetical protein [Gammaproteobacteria bacterium]
MEIIWPITWGLYSYWIIWLPLVGILLLMLSRLLRKFPVRQRRIVFRPALFILLFLPLVEVGLKTIQINRLCRSDAGLEVYEKVKAPGFFSKVRIQEGALALGFDYFEMRDGKKIYRIEPHTVGKGYKKQLIDRPTSRYVLNRVRSERAFGVRETYWSIQDNKTEKLIGESRYFEIERAWLDLLFPPAPIPQYVCRGVSRLGSRVLLASSVTWRKTKHRSWIEKRIGENK